MLGGDERKGILAVEVVCQSGGQVSRVQYLELETDEGGRGKWTRKTRLSFTHLPTVPVGATSLIWNNTSPIAL